MTVKGRHKWIPGVVIQEHDDIKREDDINTDVEAFIKLVKYARVGREVNRMTNLNWSKAHYFPEINMKKFKKKPFRGLF